MNWNKKPPAGKVRETTQINPGNQFPNNPEKNSPAKPDENPDPTKPKPGGKTKEK